MSRHKMYFAWEIPPGVVEVVKAICADYSRRSRAILQGKLSDEVRETYVRLNAAVDDALLEIEPGLRRGILEDVGYRRGYDFSKTSPYLAKNTYYQRKRKLIHDIARALSLVE